MSLLKGINRQHLNLRCPQSKVLRGISIFQGNDVQGEVRFYSANPDHVNLFFIKTSLTSQTLKSQKVGFHVHGYENGIDQQYDPKIPHYDPYKTNTHGLPSSRAPHHLGDLGNIYFDKNGECNSYFRIRAPLFGSFTLPFASIAGKILMIHGSEDDGGNISNGHSGRHVAHTKIKGRDILHIHGACPSSISESNPYKVGCNDVYVRDGEKISISIEQIAVYGNNNSPHIHYTRYLDVPNSWPSLEEIKKLKI